MLFPTIFVNNFLDDPDQVLDFAKGLHYHKNPYSPGGRSSPLHEINCDLYNRLNFKILSLMYPTTYKTMHYDGTGGFQCVPSGLEGDGWIHTDGLGDPSFQMTAILYLTKNINVGTELFVPKNTVGMRTLTNLSEKKYEYFANPLECKLEDVLKQKESLNSNFRKVASFTGEYNSLVVFDAYQYHAAQVNMSGEDRYTYIMFFSKIFDSKDQLLYHIPESRRI